MITKAASGTYCDICKARWGKMKDGTWHLKAQTPAWVTTKSELPKSRGVSRSYCRRCITEIETWPDGSLFTLSSQIQYSHGIEVFANV